MVPAVAVGEADGPGFIPRIDRLAFFPAPVHPVGVEAGGVGVQGPYRNGKGLAGLSRNTSVTPAA